MRVLPTSLVAILAVLAGACASPPPEPAPSLTRDELLDPQSCARCHPDTFREWSGSMHAYAGEDPVFVAMNQRAQRETNGRLGDFCVKCHAPMALREGLTTDGLNLASLPAKYRGVTCFFCHTADEVEGTHNNPVRLAGDLVMRGGIDAPAANGAHRSGYSALHDRRTTRSSELCGSCHDIVSPAGAHIERTYLEWRESVFSKAPGGSTCGQCHMPQGPKQEPVAVEGPARWRHSHAFPGVDVALHPFPEREAQAKLIQESLDTTLQTGLCVQALGTASRVQVIIDNVGAGHGFPSGATPDRRAWVEVEARAGEAVVYSSGTVAPGRDVVTLDDPDLWLLRDCLFDPAGGLAHHLWEAADRESNTLPPALTLDPSDPRFYQTHLFKDYPGPGRRMSAQPDRVRVKVHLQPIGFDILDDLVASGDLAPAVREAMVRHEVGANTTLEWTAAGRSQPWVDRNTGEVWSCVTTTNLNLRADRTPAPARKRCLP